jgi:hypothetical protein
MRKMTFASLNKKLFVLASLTLASQSVWASLENLSYKHFRANGFFATNSTGNSLSPELSWNPNYKLNDKWNLRGLVGAAPIKGTDENIMMTEYAVGAAYQIKPSWEIEVAGGMQSWSGEQTSPMAGANVIKTFSETKMKYIDGFFAGVSQVAHDEATTIVKFGVTLSFGHSAPESSATTEAATTN